MGCQALPSGSIQKRKSHWLDKKMILPVRVHLMGSLDGGHMTNYQKWSKTKVVALHCSFPNLDELCSEVLPLWRYDVKDFEKHNVFFLLCAFFFMKTKPNNMISPHLES